MQLERSLIQIGDQVVRDADYPPRPVWEVRTTPRFRAGRWEVGLWSGFRWCVKPISTLTLVAR